MSDVDRVVREEMDEMTKQIFGIERRTAMLVTVALAAISGLGVAYATGLISAGTFLLLGALALALAVVVVVFVRRMDDSDESVEQMLYKTDHPVRRAR